MAERKQLHLEQPGTTEKYILYNDTRNWRNTYCKCCFQINSKVVVHYVHCISCYGRAARRKLLLKSVSILQRKQWPIHMVHSCPLMKCRALVHHWQTMLHNQCWWLSEKIVFCCWKLALSNGIIMLLVSIILVNPHKLLLFDTSKIMYSFT